MKTLIEIQLRQIRDIWINFILDSNYCLSQIKFTEEVQTNYLMEILGYFSDTIDTVFTETKTQNQHDKFRFTIAFLQALYVQQDLIVEMLDIFNIGITKKDLEKIPAYSINRRIRNELVGHPISRRNNKLISTTLYSYQAGNEEIQYLKYCPEDNFNFKVNTYKISEIQLRHKELLEEYLDIILETLKNNLSGYLSELEKLKSNLENLDLESLISLAALYFKSLFEVEHLYDGYSLIEIYKKRHQHVRYQLYINKFYNDFHSILLEKIESINVIMRSKPDHSMAAETHLPKFKVIIKQSSNEKIKEKPYHETYTYELNKIATKRNQSDFDFFSKILRDKCISNKLIVSELEHMRNNFSNIIEYYTSFNLIREELGKRPSKME